ncbi:hypothetical protein KYY02_21790 [Streptomyces pimonensis]|uniref:Secreted protein n=1 Tax=Streptomyces pimonensis TaxID=2860288 RepID=A0ABV4J2S4_9ACTN
MSVSPVLSVTSVPSFVPHTLSATRPPGPPGRSTTEEYLMSTALWIVIAIALVVAVLAGIRKSRG